MEECNNSALPQAEIKAANEGAAVSVKFNKKEQKIPLEEAAALAQKGMKYDLIYDDFSRLKTMAQKSGQSISEFLDGIEDRADTDRLNTLLDETGGNRELCEHILKLEKEQTHENRDLIELQEMFPEIKQIGELPQEVVKRYSAGGKNLLDLFLRHKAAELLKEKRNRETSLAAGSASIGSQKSGGETPDSANYEFLKGLWNR